MKFFNAKLIVGSNAGGDIIDDSISTFVSSDEDMAAEVAEEDKWLETNFGKMVDKSKVKDKEIKLEKDEEIKEETKEEESEEETKEETKEVESEEESEEEEEIKEETKEEESEEETKEETKEVESEEESEEEESAEDKKEKLEELKVFSDRALVLHEDAGFIVGELKTTMAELKDLKMPDHPGEEATDEEMDDYRFEKNDIKARQRTLDRQVKSFEAKQNANVTKRWKNLIAARPEQHKELVKFNSYLAKTDAGQIDKFAVVVGAKTMEKVFDNFARDLKEQEGVPAKRKKIENDKKKKFKKAVDTLPKKRSSGKKTSKSKYPYLNLPEYQDVVKEYRQNGNLSGNKVTDEQLNDIIENQVEMDKDRIRPF